MSDSIITLIEPAPSAPFSIFEMLKAAFCNTIDLIQFFLNSL